VSAASPHRLACGQGVHTTRDACEASNGGAGVYTPAAAFAPGTATKATCEASAGTCDQVPARRPDA
jgi:hypothetical protein